MDMNGYLAEAKLAVAHVKEKTPLGTYIQLKDTTRQPLMLPFRVMMRGAQILRENQEVAKLPPHSGYEKKIEILAEAGKRGLSGNCSEMAAILSLLERTGNPAARLHVLRRKGSCLCHSRQASEHQRGRRLDLGRQVCRL